MFVVGMTVLTARRSIREPLSARRWLRRGGGFVVGMPMATRWRTRLCTPVSAADAERHEQGDTHPITPARRAVSIRDGGQGGAAIGP
jgi:hypothetical protein